MQKIEINTKDKILIISPHPDDECIGMGGFLGQYGMQCDVLLISDGAAGKKIGETKNIISIRKKEFQQEMHFFGVNSYKMLNLPDGHLNEVENNFCASEIIGYNKIFVINGDDISLDHRAVFHMVMRALGEYCPVDSLEVYQYEVTYPLRRVTHYLDISNYIEDKIAGIKHHESQLSIFNQIRPAIALNNYRAGFVDEDCEYVEAFCAVDLSSFQKQENIIDKELQKTRYELHIEKLLCEVLLDNSGLKRFCENKDLYVYGYGHYGKKLEKLFCNGNIEIKAIIDKHKSGFNTFSEKGIRITNKDSIVRGNELVIIAVLDFLVTNQIKEELEKSNIRCITLEDFLSRNLVFTF